MPDSAASRPAPGKPSAKTTPMPRQIAHHFCRQALTLLLPVLSWLACGPASAGWYRVTNYEGLLGQTPIHLSIQQHEGDGPGGLNIYGDYYRDRDMVAIPLYGTLDEQGRLTLCQTPSFDEYAKVVLKRSPTPPVDTSGCAFRLTLADQSISGSFVEGKRKSDVRLKQTAYLDDTQGLNITGTFALPFWGQTPQYLFVGVYSPKGYVVVNVINKRSHHVIQVIHPERHGCNFGYFITLIHMNVESFPHRPEQVILRCQGPKDGYMLQYKLNPSIGKFDLVNAK